MLHMKQMQKTVRDWRLICIDCDFNAYQSLYPRECPNCGSGHLLITDLRWRAEIKTSGVKGLKDNLSPTRSRPSVPKTG